MSTSRATRCQLSARTRAGMQAIRNSLLRAILEIVSNAPQTAEKDFKLPISVSVISELQLVHNVYSGRVTIQDLYDEQIKRHDNPDFVMGMPAVNDLSQVTEVDIGFDEMMAYAKKTMQLYRDVTEPIQLVLVGETAVTTAAMAMYENLSAASNAPFEVTVVPGYPEVLALLNLPEEGLAHFPDFCREESHLL